MISIVIRTYNEEKWIGKLLKAISKQTYTNYEVVLVDSGSDDNTIEISKEYKFVKFIHISKEDFSFGYSLNMGIEKSIGDFCVFISGHCIPTNNSWLEEMIEPFATNPNIGLVYGKQESYKGITKFSEHMLFNTWFPDKKDYNQNNPFCNNANAIIKKSIWLNGLKYDENVMGLEDLVFAKEILKLNHRVAYNPIASVFHIHEENLSSIKTRYEREALTYYKVFPDQSMYLSEMFKLIILNILIDNKELFKTKDYKFNIRNISEIFKFRSLQFYGTYKGYKLNKKMLKLELKDLRKRFYYPK